VRAALSSMQPGNLLGDVNVVAGMSPRRLNTSIVGRRTSSQDPPFSLEIIGKTHLEGGQVVSIARDKCAHRVVA